MKLLNVKGKLAIAMYYDEIENSIMLDSISIEKDLCKDCALYWNMSYISYL